MEVVPTIRLSSILVKEPVGTERVGNDGEELSRRLNKINTN